MSTHRSHMNLILSLLSKQHIKALHLDIWCCAVTVDSLSCLASYFKLELVQVLAHKD